ncbi:Orotidine 5'-phosphate decarboxylase [hydrothermal vent metagenome]|uniref:Orotidine 5'-phosphate decarboxylase n=1 Tax=hydrothermal vent metagenome TaxID=652676 RepID=A0A3B0UJT8_9ZZZZ
MSIADDRLIVALDFPSRNEAQTLVEKLDERVSFYKIGYQLFYGGEGLELGKELVAAKKKVFFDLKLLDIDNSVAKGVEAIAKTGASMLTIHAYPQAMAGAVPAAKGSGLTLLAVTVLTSMDNDDLMNAGYDRDVESIVGLRAFQAREAGMGGIVCSAHEAGLVRRMTEGKLDIVTPGIRPMGANIGDQKRVVTPKEALEWGASHLVVGRPITAANDPVQAASEIIKEMALADLPQE